MILHPAEVGQNPDSDYPIGAPVGFYKVTIHLCWMSLPAKLGTPPPQVGCLPRARRVAPDLAGELPHRESGVGGQSRRGIQWNWKTFHLPPSKGCPMEIPR